MSLNLPYGVFRSTRGGIEEKFEVADNAARDILITSDLIKKGWVVYHITDDKHYKLKTYPTYASLTGVVWVEFGAGSEMSDAAIKTAYENNSNTNPLTDALLNKLNASDVTHYLTPVQATSDLTAITEASLSDKARVFVENEISDFFYNATAASGDFAPDDQTAGTGFWVKVAMDGETSASIKTKYESNADTNAYTDAEQTKVAGIETAATANDTDANLKSRANHTGTQARNTITNTKGADVTHNASAALTLNLGSFDHLDVDVSDNITAIPISNGIDDNAYEIRLKGLASVTVKLGPDWVAENAYSIDDEIELPDNQLYLVVTGFTSHATDYSNDLANLELKIRRPGTNPIILNADGLTDVMKITKEGTDLYRIEMTYA